MSIKVVGNRVLVRDVRPFEPHSDLIEVVGHKSFSVGEVAATGSLVYGIEEGQQVIFGPYSGYTFNHDGEDYLLLYQGDVIGVLA